MAGEQRSRHKSDDGCGSSEENANACIFKAAHSLWKSTSAFEWQSEPFSTPLTLCHTFSNFRPWLVGTVLGRFRDTQQAHSCFITFCDDDGFARTKIAQMPQCGIWWNFTYAAELIGAVSFAYSNVDFYTRRVYKTGKEWTHLNLKPLIPRICK